MNPAGQHMVFRDGDFCLDNLALLGITSDLSIYPFIWV